MWLICGNKLTICFIAVCITNSLEHHKRTLLKQRGKQPIQKWATTHLCITLSWCIDYCINVVSDNSNLFCENWIQTTKILLERPTPVPPSRNEAGLDRSLYQSLLSELFSVAVLSSSKALVANWVAVVAASVATIIRRASSAPSTWPTWGDPVGEPSGWSIYEISSENNHCRKSKWNVQQKSDVSSLNQMPVKASCKMPAKSMTPHGTDGKGLLTTQVTKPLLSSATTTHFLDI